MIDTFKKCIEDMENGVTNFCQDGKCIECGDCCSDLLPISEKEIKTIRKYIKKKKISPTVRINRVEVNRMFDFTCPFLDDNKQTEKCKIYKVRPEICRSFKCDIPPSKIRRNREAFWNTREGHSMREIFFGEDEK